MGTGLRWVCQPLQPLSCQAPGHTVVGHGSKDCILASLQLQEFLGTIYHHPACQIGEPSLSTLGFSLECLRMGLDSQACLRTWAPRAKASSRRVGALPILYTPAPISPQPCRDQQQWSMTVQGLEGRKIPCLHDGVMGHCSGGADNKGATGQAHGKWTLSHVQWAVGASCSGCSG